MGRECLRDWNAPAVARRGTDGHARVGTRGASEYSRIVGCPAIAVVAGAYGEAAGDVHLVAPGHCSFRFSRLSWWSSRSESPLFSDVPICRPRGPWSLGSTLSAPVCVGASSNGFTVA